MLLGIVQSLIGDHQKRRQELTANAVEQFMAPRELNFSN